MKSLASDNYSSVGQEIMDALNEANQGHVPSYGADQYTQQATHLIKHEFSQESEVFFVCNGTAANTLSLIPYLRSHHSLFITECSHILEHEVNAPSFASGAKIVTVPTHNGKIILDGLKEKLIQESYWGHHNNKPRMVSLAQATEVGTVYTLEEIAAIAELCRKHNLFLHMDGCRLYNAAVSLNTSLRAITEHIDVLSLGGTKNGLLYGEAVIFFNKEFTNEFEYIRKQHLQLQSKMRYISAQYAALFENKLWHQYAAHANAMCEKLTAELSKISAVKFKYTPMCNQIFALLPPAVIPILQQHYPFYAYPQEPGLVRLVTSFDTTPEEIDDFISILNKEISLS